MEEAYKKHGTLVGMTLAVPVAAGCCVSRDTVVATIYVNTTSRLQQALTLVLGVAF